MPLKCLKAHLEILIKILLQSNYRMSNITGKIIGFLAVAKTVTFTKWLKFKKEPVGFPLKCHPVVEEFT